MFNVYTSRYRAFEIRNNLKNILSEVTTSTPSPSSTNSFISTDSPSVAETDAQVAQSAWQTSLRSKSLTIDSIEQSELTTNPFADHETQSPDKEPEEQEEEEEFGPFISSPQPVYPFIQPHESDSLLPSPTPPTPFPQPITPPTPPSHTLLSTGLSPRTPPQHDARTRRIRRFGKSTLRDARLRDMEREKEAKKVLKVFEERLTDKERERLKGALERMERVRVEKRAVGIIGVVAAALGWRETAKDGVK